MREEFVSQAESGLNVLVKYGIEFLLIWISSVFSPTITKTWLNRGTLAGCAFALQSASGTTTRNEHTAARRRSERPVIGIPPGSRGQPSDATPKRGAGANAVAHPSLFTSWRPRVARTRAWL